MIVLLTGGIGGAKLAVGLSKVLAPKEITIIVNTGDDIELLGLRICPDVDTVIYSLTGRVNSETGWGLKGDSRQCLDSLEELGWPAWFQLGDRDLATHLWRTHLLREGTPLSGTTRDIASSLGLETSILPMSDSFVPTYLDTDRSFLHFQEYFVRDRCEPRIRSIEYRGADSAMPAPGVLDAIDRAALIVLAPSNPFISIGPILAIPGIRAGIRNSRARVAAVTPIVQGRALKGPTAKMMSELGYPASAVTVASLYRDFLDLFWLDERDAECEAQVRNLGIETHLSDTIMTSTQDKIDLARRIVEVS